MNKLLEQYFSIHRQINNHISLQREIILIHGDDGGDDNDNDMINITCEMSATISLLGLGAGLRGLKIQSSMLDLTYGQRLQLDTSAIS